MRDRMERFVLFPFTAGCISESSIAVGLQQAKRSKMDMGSTPTREKDEEEEEYEEDEESLSGENYKSPSSLLAIPRFQKLFKNFKNFSQSFGLDGCASSILSKGWNNLTKPDTTNLPSFPSTPLQVAMAMNAENPTIRSLLETK